MKISISVPKPCHENWNAMTARTDERTGITGRHCDRCEHTVMDLTRVSDAQLVDLFRKDAVPKCARFSPAQLDRVIAMEADRGPRLIPAAVVGAAMALSAADASAQNCSPKVGKMLVRPVEQVEPPTVGQMIISRPVEEMIKGEVDVRDLPPMGPDSLMMDSTVGGSTGQVEIRRGRTEVFYYIDGVRVPASAIVELPPRTEDALGLTVVETRDTITGRVLDGDGSPLPFVSVQVHGTELSAVTDMDGRYILLVPERIATSPSTLTISSVGYLPHTVQVPAFSRTPIDDACIYNDKAPLTGRIVGSDGRGVGGVNVELLETGASCRSNAHGYFSFDEPVDGDHDGISISMTDGEGAQRKVNVRVGALPCCVAIDLPIPGTSETVTSSKIDLGDTVMEEGELMILGELATFEVQQDTLLTRAARPFRWIGERIGNILR